MMEYWAAIVTAGWLGVMTAISPCPMATNIVAISYIGRKVDKPRNVLLSGLLYTLGRSLTYAVLGILLSASLLSAPALSHALQKYMTMALGPLLILAGMVLLELIPIPMKSGKLSEGLQKRVDTMGMGGALVLGVLFALSFCPISAALFFGILIPLALQQESALMLPAVYGITTGIPVFLFAIVLALSANKVGQMFNSITIFERWARRITGVLFIGVGIYYCLIYLFANV